MENEDRKNKMRWCSLRSRRQQNGEPEIIVGTTGHPERGDRRILCLNNRGETLWTRRTGDEVRSPPWVCDVDADGRLEIITGSNRVYCLAAATGKTKWRQEAGDWVDPSPWVCDVDGDGALEVLIGSLEGRVWCLGVGMETCAGPSKPEAGSGLHLGLETWMGRRA